MEIRGLSDGGNDYFCKQKREKPGAAGNRESQIDDWDLVPEGWSWGICDDGCLTDDKCELLNLQGVSRLLYFLTHPFSQTYVDTAGCPFMC